MLSRLLRGSFISIIYICLYIPIVILIINSFNNTRFTIHWHEFTMNWYKLLLKNHYLLQSTKNSLIIACASSTLATVIGLTTAIALYQYRFRGKFFVISMLFIVMTSPDIVVAISLLILFIFLNIKLGFWSLLFSHITFCLPFVVITIYSWLKEFDVRIVEAAKDLGASEIKILCSIIFPLAIPAVIGSWLLSFALSIDDVVVSSFVSGPEYEILPLKIYSMIKTGISPEINALTTMQLLFSLILIFLSQIVFYKIHTK